MKNLKNFKLLVLTAILGVAFSACNKENGLGTDQQEPEYITVNLGVAGEYLEISESPLTRAAGSDLIAISVSEIEFYPGEGGHYMEKGNYAFGVFSSLDNVSIKLFEGKIYRFKASIIVDPYTCPNGHTYECDCRPNDWIYAASTEFKYNINPVINLTTVYGGGCRYERYYGELDVFDPSMSTTAEIHTKRVSYGAHYIVDGLTEGYLSINVSDNYYVSIYADEPEHEGIYTFNSIWSAWKGTYVPEGTGGGYYTDSYSETYNLTLQWVKDNGSITPLGTYQVTFKRNVKTTIRIDVEDTSAPNGIVVTRQEAAWAPDENEYHISGGNLVEVPVDYQ